jgi:hypothetical protein
VKTKAMKLMNKLSENDLQLCFNSTRFAWSGVGIGDGNTLRVTFLLCNLLINNILKSVRLIYSHTMYEMLRLLSAFPKLCSSGDHFY